MRKSLTLVLTMLLAGALAASAAVPNMALDRSGTLYRLGSDGEQLVLTINSPSAEEPIVIPVPQTTGIAASSTIVDFDASTATVVAVWQENISEELSRIMLATYHDGTWFGPVSVAGDDGVSASNPSLLVHRTTLPPVVSEESATAGTEDAADAPAADEPPSTITMIHLAWWEGPPDSTGTAAYGSTSLGDDGIPAVEDFAPVELRSLLPFGIVCDSSESSAGLTHPRLFIDQETGDPHVVFADLSDCLFEIVRLHLESPDAAGGEDPPVTSQRRRNVIVFGVRKHIAIKPGLPLDRAEMVVGRGLSIVMHWDDPDQESIDYITLGGDGWSEVSYLKLGPSLSHENGVRLIERLAQ